MDDSTERRMDLYHYSRHEGSIIEHKKLSEREIRAEIDACDGCLAFMDSQVGVLMEIMQKRGELDRTIVNVDAEGGQRPPEHRWEIPSTVSQQAFSPWQDLRAQPPIAFARLRDVARSI